ncbi:unnamed protein product [Absidia cylindrospora]
MTLAVDLLHPTVEHEKRSHKLKRLVQSPNSYFMDVKCPGCLNISTVFSHAQLSFCVPLVVLSSANLLVVVLVLLKAALSARRLTKWSDSIRYDTTIS